MQVLREISVKKRRHEISQHPNSGTSFLPRHSLSLCSPHEQVDNACCLADPFRSSRGKKSMSTSRATGSLHCLQSQYPRLYILKNMIASIDFLHLIPIKLSNIFRNQVSMIRGDQTFIIYLNLLISLSYFHELPEKVSHKFIDFVHSLRHSFKWAKYRVCSKKFKLRHQRCCDGVSLFCQQLRPI